MKVSPLAGKPAPKQLLINVNELISAYGRLTPDVTIPGQRISFGTSGHRGSSLKRTFNEAHIVATTQAICEYRIKSNITGPLFLGADTHALSEPARVSTIEVLAANGINVMLAVNDEYTPTPAISHAILVHNRDRKSDLADGIVITPSHNPPEDGGFKYNPPNGGPADTNVTDWIQNRANEILATGLKEVKRVPLARALSAPTTHRHDYLESYVRDLGSVVDFEVLQRSKIKMGVDPLGGAGVHYWPRIAELYGIDLTIVNKEIDPTFSFLTVDWDGKIRMDPSSSYAMQSLVGLKDRFDIAFACDTDHDRHGIVVPKFGLMSPNHFLSVSINYLFQNRPNWSKQAAIGKTLVSSIMIDRVAAKLGRRVYEVPVGFKWFVDGLLDGSLGFVGEESAGASFLRRDGTVWTTDKDGFVPALLSAEITARTGKNPGQLYKELTDEFGEAVYDRIEAPVNAEQRKKLAALSKDQIKATVMAGEKITGILNRAPGNDAAIGGLKVMTESGWFAARPSGTEDIYKIYAESLKGREHLNSIINEAQHIIDRALNGG